MLHTYLDNIDFACERQKAYLQEAEHMRKINAFLEQKKDKHGYFLNTINRFGIRMERWGQQLQNQVP